MSSEFYVYLKMPEYLAQWINYTFGYPTALLKDSPESRVLNECLVKIPKNQDPDTGEDHNVMIEIPYFKGKHPLDYNYLHQSGKKAIEESFRTLMLKNLVEEVGAIENCNAKKATLIYMWMEKHGIDEKHWDTVSQIYYRIRKKYFEEKKIKVS